jgi:hypothetical protein
MDHDVISPAILCVKGEIKNRVEILIRHRNDDSGFAGTLFDRNLEVALPFGETHREELALLAGDEQALYIDRRPASFSERSSLNGFSAAAQMPRICSRE